MSIEHVSYTSTDSQYKFSEMCKCDLLKMMNMFNDFRSNGQLCDITLNVQGMEVQAHKLVLAARSPYFRTMFTSNFTENKKLVIEIDKKKHEDDPTHLGLKAEAFKDCIEYIYTGKLEINKPVSPAEMETLGDLLKVVSFLELSQLQESILEILVNPNENYLNWDSMKMVIELFGPYDSQNVLHETVRKELAANWDELKEEFSDGWEFISTVWPNFRLPKRGPVFERWWPCCFCEEFISESGESAHLKTHYDCLFKCSECKAGFIQYKTALEHVESAHEKECFILLPASKLMFVFKCGARSCGWKFIGPGGIPGMMKRHVKNNHKKCQLNLLWSFCRICEDGELCDSQFSLEKLEDHVRKKHLNQTVAPPWFFEAQWPDAPCFD